MVQKLNYVKGTPEKNWKEKTFSDGTVPTSETGPTGPVNEVYPYRVATFFKINQ